MTRINVGVRVRLLTDEHLLAEHREIKRLPSAYEVSLRSGSIERIPTEFCLGKGHVLFFVDKPHYTFKRYCQLYRECVRRGFAVEYYGDNWDVYPLWMLRKRFSNIETDKSRELILSRISERIKSSSKKNFHYYGESISKRKAITILSQ